IDTNTGSSGQGGALTVAATEAISIRGRGSGLFSNTFGSGDTGQMSIATPMLAIAGGRIQAAVDSQGSGNARGIRLEVGRLTLRRGAQIDTSSYGSGHGGDLSVMAADVITISNNEGDFRGGLFSNAHGSGNAGSRVISAPALRITNGRVNTASSGNGNAGDLTVEVGKLTLTGGGQLDTSTSGAGQGGKLTVRATDSISIAGQHEEFPS